MTTILLDNRPNPAKQAVQWVTVLHQCGHSLGHKLHPRVSDDYAAEIAAGLATSPCANCARGKRKGGEG